MATVYKTTFQLRRGNLVDWETKNPILAVGEPSFVIDQFKLKIGDGSTAWKDLPYVADSDIGNYVTIDDVVNGIVLPPIATEGPRGTVLSSAAKNEISVDPTDGSMEVNSLSIDKLDTEGINVILNGGTAISLV